MKKNNDEVAIFWDYENCPAPTNTSGYTIVNNIRSVAQTFGRINLFKAYLEVSEHVPLSRPLLLFSELQSSGVSLTDCPHHGRKDVADKMIIVDMLAHAIDNPAPSTIILISGDRDFAYALSILRLRHYHIVLITLSNAHPSLRSQASLCLNWISDVLGTVDPTSVLHQPTSPRRRKTSMSPTHNRSHSDINGYNLSRPPFQESYGEKPAASSVEFINYCQDKAKYRDICLTPPKRDIRPDFLPPELEPSTSKSQSAASMASTDLRNGPELPARVIYSPVPSSCRAHLNDNVEKPLIMTGTPHDLSSLKTLPSTGGNTPKLGPHAGSIMASRFRTSLRRSTSLPNVGLGRGEVASVKEPVSFDSAWQPQILLPADPDLRGFSNSLPNLVLEHEVASVTEPVSWQTQILPAEPDLFSPLPQQQSAHSTKSYSLSTVNQIYDPDDDPDSSPPHLNIVYLPTSTNVTTTLPTFAPSFTPSSSLNHTTMPTPAQSSVKTTYPSQPPAVPDKFKILVQCLKSHRSKGILRPLRTEIAVEIARNGSTYRQAGVSKFRQYAAIAEKEGIIELGGWQGTAWVALLKPWV